jgi:hypothetical protein
MMTEFFDRPQFRLGTFALVDRVVHQASYAPGREFVIVRSWQRDNPDPEVYDWDEHQGQWRAELPVDRCERVYSVHVYAKYREQRVRVEKVNTMGTTMGTAVVMYAGWDGLWATENGFLSQNRHEYHKTVPLSQLKDVYEKHDDLLFSRWRVKTFSGPVWPEQTAMAAKQTDRPRSGQFATLEDKEYQVLGRALGGRLTIGCAETDNPDSEVFTWHPQRGLWTATLPSERFERIVEVTTRAEYVGHPCEIVSISPEGMVELHYLGEDTERARAAGFTQSGKSRAGKSQSGKSQWITTKWINTVNIFDLARYHEFHRELSPDS